MSRTLGHADTSHSLTYCLKSSMGILLFYFHWIFVRVLVRILTRKPDSALLFTVLIVRKCISVRSENSGAYIREKTEKTKQDRYKNQKSQYALSVSYSIKSLFHSIKHFHSIKPSQYVLPVCNSRGFSIVEVLITAGIMAVVLVGLMQSSIISLKNQGLIHSRISEGNFREMLNNNRFHCTNSFASKKIGESITQIQNKDGVAVWDRSVKNGLFQNNFLIADIKTREKEDLANPGNPTPGYAQMIVSFSRPSSLFERKDQSRACDANDQTGCYQLECLVKLNTESAPGVPHTGTDGSTVGVCELETCAGGFRDSQEHECLSVYDTTLPNDVLFVGCGTTEENTTKGTLAFGRHAGSGNNTGLYNTFIGHSAGQNNTAGKHNIFLGYKAGFRNTIGRDNIFVGSFVGQHNTGGFENIFIGANSGNVNTTGSYNVFVGKGSGNANTTGRYNVFLGWAAGETNTAGSGSIFLGSRAGHRNTTGNWNIFLGHNAGINNRAGHNNIFIGPQAGSTSEYTDKDNKLVIGNSRNNTWIVGDIGTNTLKVNNKTVCLQGGPRCSSPSSRTLKKNIRAFKNFDKALQDILKTPLFSYQFKDNQPDKKRMGIISEELPERLQIKSQPVQPDWPSIYGTLWAGIKALHKLFVDFKKDILSKLTEELAAAQDQTVKQLEAIQTENTRLSRELEEQKSKNTQFSRELEDTKKQINKLKLAIENQKQTE